MGVLDGKAAVVTGGGTGIGAAIARALAREGARVALGGRRREPVERVAAEIGGVAVAADVAAEADVAALIATCRERFGRLDVLVPNAGHGGGGLTRAEDVDTGEWDRTFAVNARGVMLCLKHAVPLLKVRGGAVVVVASTSALRPNPRQMAYAASKAATLAIVKSAAQELGEFDIRVNAICPGAVDTDLYRGNAAARTADKGQTVEDDKRRLAGLAWLRRLATAEEIAAAAVYLASDAARSMTGQFLTIDGGRM